MYLIEQYGTKSNLFGNSVKERALISQRLFFNSNLFDEVKHLLVPVIYGDASKFDEKTLSRIYEMLEFLECFLKTQEYVAGKFVTIADFFLVNNVISFKVSCVTCMSFYILFSSFFLTKHLGMDLTKLKHVNDWVLRMKVLTGFAECDEGSVALSKLVLPKLK